MRTIKFRGKKQTEDKHWQDVRERAAIAAMQSLLCAPIKEGFDPNPSKEQIIEYSIALADELVKQLKKEYNE